MNRDTAFLDSGQMKEVDRFAMAAGTPGPREIRVTIAACGVCRTDLHVVDGELPDPRVPIIPGHEIVGRIDAIGSGVEGLHLGERVGIPWLGHTCGVCPYCRSHRENLCDRHGFGAAAHIVVQVAKSQGRSVFAFTRPGDVASQAFARRLGLVWTGGSDEMPPEPLDAQASQPGARGSACRPLRRRRSARALSATAPRVVVLDRVRSDRASSFGPNGPAPPSFSHLERVRWFCSEIT